VRTRHRLACTTAAAGLLVALPACGDDGAQPATAPEAAEAVGADPGATPVEVAMVDYDYEGLPDTVPAGTRFSVVNRSDGEVHELVAFRLPDGEDRSVDELLTLPPDQLGPALGGEPALVLIAAPGGPMIAPVGDGTLREPGRYAVLCFVPTGADPQAFLDALAESEGGPPEVPGGPPHFVQGMAAELTVTP
jgi:hypothetical protein